VAGKKVQSQVIICCNTGNDVDILVPLPVFLTDMRGFQNRVIFDSSQPGPRSVLVVKGFYSEEDLQDANSGEQKIGESISFINQDLTALRTDLIDSSYAISMSKPVINRLSIFVEPITSFEALMRNLEESYFVMFKPDVVDSITNSSMELPSCSSEIMIISATFDSRSIAEYFMCASEGTTICGKLARSFLELYEVDVKNLSTSEPLKDESIVNAFKLSTSAKPFMPQALRSLEAPSSQIRVSKVSGGSAKVSLKKTNLSAGAKYTEEVVPKKYVGALGVEKQPKRTTQTDPDIYMADTEIDEILKGMIKRLDELQRRALELDPVHGNLKERFVKGIKQSTNLVKAGRARLVLIASDIEDSETLDGKLQEMILLAKQREIPTLYCLSRRQLGKAVGSTFRQSAVALRDPDGAYPEFKKILAYLEGAKMSSAKL
jgi:ribosomal protein L7Ae-like RNA K-turn-binding protein